MSDAIPRRTLGSYAWASPNTLFGVLVGLLTLSKMKVVDGVVEILSPRAMSLLSFILNFIGKITRSEMIAPSAFTLGHTTFSGTQEGLDYWRPHERVHVRQNEKWGITWVPAYVISSIVVMTRGGDPYYENVFEIEAYSVWPPQE